jgi:hypothetical protein
MQAINMMAQGHDARPLFEAVPELMQAVEASNRVREAVREVTAPDARRERARQAAARRRLDSADGSYRRVAEQVARQQQGNGDR